MSVGKQVMGLLVSFLLVTIVAAIGGGATGSAIGEWYVNLEKPFFNPPNWVFGPAWTLFYSLMAIASWMVWRKGMNTFGVTTALGLYGIQLVLNLLWSVFFFGLRMPGLALVEIIILEVFIILTFINFKRVTPVAGYLLIPYILWVLFATTLNAAIWWLN